MPKISYILVTNVNEILYSINNLKDVEKKCFVPWSVETFDYLKFNKLNYYDISDEFSKIKLTEDIFNNFIFQYRSFLDRMDYILKEEYKEIKFNFFSYNFSDSRGIFLSIIENIEKFNLLFKKINYNFIFFDTDPTLNKIINLFINSNYFTDIKIDKINLGIKQNINKYNDVINPFDISENSILNTIKIYIKNILKLIIGRKFYYKSLSDIFNSFFLKKIKRDNKVILIYDTIGYEISDLLKKLKKNKNISFVFREDLRIKKKYFFNFDLNKISLLFKKDLLLKKICKYKNFDISNILIDNFLNIFNKHINVFYNNYIFFLNLVKKNKIDLIISGAELPMFLMLQDIIDNKSKSITFLHGGTCGYAHTSPPMSEYRSQKKNNNYYFVYTKNIENFQKVKKNYFGSKMNHISVGSNYFYNIRDSVLNANSSSYNKDLNICYVVSPINTPKKFERGVGNDINQYKLIIKLIKIFGNKPKVNFSIKLSYGIGQHIKCLINDIKQNYYNVSLTSEQSKINDIVNHNHIFILTTFSTPLFELMSFKKKLIVFFDKNYFSISDEFLMSLKNSSVLHNDYEKFFDFCEYLSINERSNTEDKSFNDSFYENFCNNLQNKKPFEKMYNEVIKILDL